MNSKVKIRNFLGYALIIIVLGITLFPFIYMVSSSLKSSYDIFIYPPKLFGFKVSLEHYIYVLKTSNFLIWFRNGVIVATAVSIMSVIISLLGAFSLTRYKYRGRDFLGNVILLTYMFPSISLLIPLFLTLKRFGLVDSLYGLIITHVTFAVPFSMWLMRSYIMTIPVEMEEAAQIDGCTKLGALIRITTPALLPGIITTFLYSFILSWNEYMYALTLITSENYKTLPIGLQSFMTRWNIQWGEMMAAGTIASIPVVVLFIFLQKYLVEGLSAGAIKG